MKKLTSIALILKTYALVVAIFFIFRVILFLTEIDRIDFQAVDLQTIFNAFIMGIRFDVVIASYVLALPTLIMVVLSIVNKRSRLFENIVFYWILSLFSLCFIFSAIDIPYFNQFFSRLSIGAFEWLDNFGFVVSMIIQEPKYFLTAIPLILFIILFRWLLKKIFAQYQLSNKPYLALKITCSVLFFGFIFLGIRGRLEKKSPIRIGTAYFSDHAFLNQLGLNPVFTLLRSYLDQQNKDNKSLALMDNQQAIGFIKTSLNIKGHFTSPIARTVIPIDTIESKTPNIVLVIMESMSAAKMGRHGNEKNMTPFLDSLSHQSLYFDQIYTAGKHTFNGIFSSMFSFPALYRKHPMKNIKSYHGASNVLKSLGYSTTYFTTHDGQFDNAEGFLRANAFDNIISQKDYPKEAIKSTLGVPDDYMFNFAIPKINALAESDKPFFVSFMTASDHGPYYVPPYFIPKNSDIKDQIVEYADWSLKQFIQSASTEDWFDNTMFIFIADHGAAMDASYDISLDYHHSPLIFYAPTLLKDYATTSNIGGQIDLFPTLMGLINQPYINNTLGIDLLNETRPFTIVNDDDKIGVLNDSLFLIMKEGEPSKLYRYKNKNTQDFSSDYPAMVADMELYAKANLQTYQYLLDSPHLLNATEEISPDSLLQNN
jgi:phosphoglycerol transferase MdoB-like AlkP superfamily enzyme